MAPTQEGSLLFHVHVHVLVLEAESPLLLLLPRPPQPPHSSLHAGASTSGWGAGLTREDMVSQGGHDYPGRIGLTREDMIRQGRQG